jgi:hypothetical protein
MPDRLPKLFDQMHHCIYDKRNSLMTEPATVYLTSASSPS